MMTLLELSDVAGKPQAKLDLPVVQLGTRIRLRFNLRRENAGRSEVLVVDGQYRVAAVGLDVGCSPQRQVLSVESTSSTPSWRAVKKAPKWRRALPPAKAPRTVIE